MEVATFLPDAETVAAIEKDVATYNQRRDFESRQLARRRPAILTIYVVAVAVIGYIAFLATGGLNWFHALIGGAAIGLWPQVNRQITHSATWTQQDFRYHILPVMFGFIRDLRYEHGTRPRSFDRIPKAMLPSHNRSAFDDTIAGTLNGHRFELAEMKLEQKSKNSSTVVFQGAVLHCRLSQSFPGTLVATRKIGDFQRFFRDLFGSGGMVEIVSGNERLDRLYEFRTDQRSDARRLLAGGLAATLEAIWRQWPNDTAQFGLNGHDAYVMLPSSRNFFELPQIGTPVTYKADLEPMVRHIAAFLAIAEQVRAIELPPPAAHKPDL